MRMQKNSTTSLNVIGRKNSAVTDFVLFSVFFSEIKP